MPDNNDGNVNDGTAVENEVVATDNNEAKPKESAKVEGKLYTQEQFESALKQRLSRFKTSAIEQTVEERTQELNDRLKVIEDERNAFKRENEVLSVSKETGVSADLLKKTNLDGDDLKSFAQELAEQNKGYVVNQDALNKAIVDGMPQEDEVADFYKRLRGDK